MIVFNRRITKPAAIGLALFVIITATALAAWLVSSTGDAGGKIATLTAPVVSAAAASSGCVPSGSCDATVRVENTSGAALKITGITSAKGEQYSGGTRQATGFNASCPDTNVTVAPKTSLAVDVPAGTSNVTVPNVYALSPSAPDACQGLSFTYPVRVDFKAGT